MSDELQQSRDEIAEAIYTYSEQTAAELREVIRILSSDGGDIAVGGDTDRFVENSPVAGVKRAILSERRVAGSDGLAIAAATAVQIVPMNLGRLGGSIINSGANSALIYLAPKERVSVNTAGIGALFLSAGGGSWDFRLGDTLWCGPVTVISSAGTTIVWAAI